jgi:hypothetical protein
MEKEIKEIITTKIKKPNNLNKVKTSVKKKKREVNLYSEEYLKKKYGLTLKDAPSIHNKKKFKSNFGFYSYLVTISIFIIAIFGVLNLTRDIIVKHYPITESYINYLYEVIDILKITISGLAS